MHMQGRARDARGQGLALYGMGSARFGLKQYDEAWSLFEKALALLEEAGDEREQCITLHEMGKLKLAIGKLAPARQILERGLAMAEANGDEEGVKHFRETLAEVEAQEKEGSHKTGPATKPAKKRKKKTARSSKKKT